MFFTMKDKGDTIVKVLHSSSTILLISHISPDGDTVGSALALRLALLELEKKVILTCDEDIPSNLSFLPGGEFYELPENICGHFDTAIAIDVSAIEMMGRCYELFEKADNRIVIDHHVTNLRFGEYNFIRSGEAACSQLVYELILKLNGNITAQIANCLLLGLSTDTGHFQYAGTTALTLKTASELVEAGADISFISRKIYRTVSVRKINIKRFVYNNLRFSLGGQVCSIIVLKDDCRRAGCDFSDLDGLVNIALEIENVRIAFMISERDEGSKISLRAVEPDTVNDIAMTFGGGGHAQAAGCSLMTDVHSAYDLVLDEIKRKLSF